MRRWQRNNEQHACRLPRDGGGLLGMAVPRVAMRATRSDPRGSGDDEPGRVARICGGFVGRPWAAAPACLDHGHNGRRAARARGDARGPANAAALRPRPRDRGEGGRDSFAPVPVDDTGRAARGRSKRFGGVQVRKTAPACTKRDGRTLRQIAGRSSAQRREGLFTVYRAASLACETDGWRTPSDTRRRCPFLCANAASGRDAAPSAGARHRPILSADRARGPASAHAVDGRTVRRIGAGARVTP